MSQAAPAISPRGRSALAAVRLRVMHVVLSLDPGGTERLVIEISKTLMPYAQPSVCCLDSPGSWARELEDQGVSVTALHRREGFRPGLGFAIARLADEQRIDVLHCHHYSPFVYGRIGAMRRGVKVVYTEHGRSSDDGPSWKRRLVNPLLGRLPSTICAVSHDLRGYMISEGLPADRVRVVHNGIDPGRRPSSIESAKARLALGIPHDAFVVGTAGRLDPVKDLETLIDAAAMMSASQPKLRVVIIGDGSSRGAIEARIAAAGLGSVVSLAGYRQDVRELLPALDVYANTSIHEGVSLTILEAMAAAIPVVATRVGGTPEVVVDGETGMLVPARTPAAMSAAIERLAASAERRRAVGQTGRVRVERHFSRDAMAGAYLQAYRGIMES